MAKVFRLHDSNANNTFVDWCNSNVYGANVIGQIIDPDGARASKEITSIPSPFARIDLVKTAFKEVIDDMDGNTIYHKMVSDTLDIAQILFNYETLRDKIEIIEWRRNGSSQTIGDLDELKGNPSHIGDTLETFLESDAQTYHFDKMDNFYILAYKGPDRKSPADVIGATSPATLFFSSANDLSYISKHIHFGQDCPFDGNYCPLYKRDIEFVKYLFALRASYRDFATDFMEFNEYLNLTYKQLSTDQQTVVDDAQKKVQNFTMPEGLYDELKFGNVQVSILNGLHYHVKPKPKPHCDFMIDSSLCVGDKPLVLPVEGSTAYSDFMYVSAAWGRDSKAPYYCEDDVDKRHLPYENNEYPYLTISDFLEDYLIKFPEEINAQAFFDGNKKGEEGTTYLIPVKPLYFKYFDVDKLTGAVENGKKSIEITPMAGGAVKVILRIPVSGHGTTKYVEYSRLYIVGNADLDKNQGGIKEYDSVAFGLFPNIAFKNDAEAFYRFAIASDFGLYDKFALQCYSGSSVIPAKEIVRNENDKSVARCQTYLVDKKKVDYIQFQCTNGNACGLVIPAWEEKSGTAKFTFAIDLGTSNTHIEYNINSKSSNTFDVTDGDMQFVTLTAQPDPVLKYVFDADFCPAVIGGAGAEFRFPIRTVLSAGKNTNWDQDQDVLPMGYANVAFTYCKRQDYEYNNQYTNLKWSKDNHAINQLTSYIESLMLMLRNKVVLNGGDLKATRIVWFYPISMTRAQVNKLSKIWKEAYAKYFGSESDGNVRQMTESIAPYVLCKSKHGTANIVTIDIGGGTTDIVMASGGKIDKVTSFRFAANTLFSNYLNSVDGELNGILRFFKDDIDSILSNNNVSSLSIILEHLAAANSATELASFFFSLSDNKQVKDKGISKNVDFLRMLSTDDKQKIVFILFYASIIYHVASILKSENREMPEYISFSGNGSKVISVLTDDEKVLSAYTKKIFETVYGKGYDHNGNLTIEYKAAQPKEATCKGGILWKDEYFLPIDEVDAKFKVTLKAYDNCSFVNEETYADIDESYINHVAEQVQKFITLFFDLDKSFDYNGNFEVDNASMAVAEEVCQYDIKRFIRDMLAERKEEVNEQDKVVETMFFYAIVGLIYNMADKISEAYGK